MRIIPAIDLKDGKCVRLFKGDFERVTEYSDDPVAVARAFVDFATTDLHIVDLDGARTGRQANRDVIAQIAEATDLAIQVGGGIRDRSGLEGWFDLGVARCVIGSLAITEPDALRSWIVRFGPERIVLALDVRIDEGTPFITTHGWTQPTTMTVFDCIDSFRDVGVVHVLCTDVSRDGAMAGPNVQLYEDILARFPNLLLQASGGIRDVSDLETLRGKAIPAAITGRALLDGKIVPEEIVSFQQNV